MTEKQHKAIKQMEKALAALKRADIMICGMDNDLLYATGDKVRKVVRNESSSGNYCEVAMVNQHDTSEDTGSFKNSVYQDSGGW